MFDSSCGSPGPGDSYQTVGVAGNLPVFYQHLKDQLTFPLSWTSGNFSNFALWRKTARNKVLEKIIQVPVSTPYNAKVLKEQDRGVYLARKVVLNLTAASRVLGLLLVPKGRGPFPAALLLHDHGAKFDIGKEKMIEPWGNPAQLKSAQGWAEQCYSGRFIGNELAARGYVVFAVDALGWGDRGGISYETQQALASNLMGLGTSPAGLLAYEDLRSAAFLASLSEVNPAKVAAVGFSMGSYRAWQVAALSEAIQAGIAVCWLGTVKGLITPGNNTVRGQSAFYMTHPGLANELDYPDVASIAAPKPMLFYNGGQDKLFPTAVVQEAYAKMKAVWQSQNAAAQLVTQIWPDRGHIFDREMQAAAFDWLDRWAHPART
jgi:dienelactone hydrolase